MSEPSAFMRPMEKTTSSAVNGSPLWNLTFGRRYMRQIFGSGCSPFSASAGTRSGVLPAPHQRLVDLTEPGKREGFGQRLRIERGGIDTIGVAECLGLGFTGHERKHKRKVKKTNPRHGGISPQQGDHVHAR